MEGIPVDLDERAVKIVAKNRRLCKHGRTSGSAGIISSDIHIKYTTNKKNVVHQQNLEDFLGVPPIR